MQHATRSRSLSSCVHKWLGAAVAALAGAGAGVGCATGTATEDVEPSGADAGAPDVSVSEDAPANTRQDSGPYDGGQNASDSAAASPRPSAGEVLITEVMYDPSGGEPDQEWIELFNTAGAPRVLSGLVLRDGVQRTHTIGSAPFVVIGPGSYVILARDKAAASAAGVPSARIVYDYGASAGATEGILLGNGVTGAIVLLDGAKEIASALYGGWFDQVSPGGRSVQLKGSTAAQAGTAAGWCLSATVWSSGADHGTPGAPSDCP